MSNDSSPTLSKITPEENIKPTWKPGCWTYFCVIGLTLIVVVWFFIFRSGPPLRIAPDTTYITEPLTPDGKYVDYLAAFEQRYYPPEMATDENGYRVVFRAVGPLESSTPEQIQQRYDKLGLDVIRDKPTLPYIVPYEFINERYQSHPEDFENYVAAVKVKREIGTKAWIAAIVSDAEMMVEEKESYFYDFSEDGRGMGMMGGMPCRDREKVIADIRRIDEISNNAELPVAEKAEQVAALVQSIIDEVLIDEDYIFYFQSDAYLDWLQQSPELHQNVIMQDWLRANTAALDLIVESSKKPVFVTPLVLPEDATTMYEILLPDVQSIRDFTRGLRYRAMIHISEGDIDAAIEDILAGHRLGRHLNRPCCLAQQLVGISCENIAHSIAFHANPAMQADTEQLKRLQDGLNNLPPRGTWQEGVEMERLMMLDTLTVIMNDPRKLMEFANSIRSGGPSSPSIVDMLMEVGITWSGKDWNIVFRRVNEAFDQMLAGIDVDPRPSLKPNRFMTIRPRSEEFADICLALFGSSVEYTREAFRRLACCDNMKRIVLAIHLYEREHGTLPPALTLDANGKPLHGWRTLLLPYLGDEELAELYAQIRLDEPWDSEYNRQFHARNLDVYRCPSNVSMLDGDTSYSVIVGDGLLFTNDGHGQTLAGHGPNMLLVVEHRESVCWMRPDAEILQADAESGITRQFYRFTGMGMGSMDEAEPVAVGCGTVRISSNHPGGCNFGLLDGGVTFISGTMDATVFQELIRGTAKERP